MGGYTLERNIMVSGNAKQETGDWKLKTG